MKKTIRDNTAVFVCESIQEAIDLLSILSSDMLYTKYNNCVYKLEKLKQIIVTVRAEFESVEGEANDKR